MLLKPLLKKIYNISFHHTECVHQIFVSFCNRPHLYIPNVIPINIPTFFIPISTLDVIQFSSSLQSHFPFQLPFTYSHTSPCFFPSPIFKFHRWPIPSLALCPCTIRPLISHHVHISTNIDLIFMTFIDHVYSSPLCSLSACP